MLTTVGARTLTAALAELDPAAIDWHAERYDSASRYSGLLALARRYRHQARDLHPAVLVGCARSIAKACQDDGADYGFIPCLGGDHRRVWLMVRELTGV